MTDMRERKTIIDDCNVEEINVDGEMLVCIDGKLTDETYEAACKRLNLEGGQRDLDDYDMPGGFN